MNKLNIPSLHIQYFDLKIYNIQCTPDITSDSIVSIVAPDTYTALSVFSALFPSRDVLKVFCVGPCVSVFPQV